MATAIFGAPPSRIRKHEPVTPFNTPAFQKEAANFIPLDRFQQAAHRVEPDGRISSGAEAVFRARPGAPSGISRRTRDGRRSIPPRSMGTWRWRACSLDTERLQITNPRPGKLLLIWLVPAVARNW
jgi:hypothetical protein